MNLTPENLRLMSSAIRADLIEIERKLAATTAGYASQWSRIFASGTLATKTLYPLKTLVDGVVTPAIDDDVMAITRDVVRKP